MEEQNKIVIRITDEGIIFYDCLVMGYDELLHLIVQEECKIIFDSKDAFQNLKNGIEPYIEENYCIELATMIEKFIAEQYALQVLTNIYDNMIKVEIIGNLGADAMLQEKNGNRFVAFRVANTDKWVDKATGQVIESTQWISCTLNGDGGALLPYLKKGTKVFVRGNAQFVVFSSAKTRQMEVGVNLFVREIELCGGAKENQQQPQQPGQTPQQPEQPQGKNSRKEKQNQNTNDLPL